MLQGMLMFGFVMRHGLNRMGWLPKDLRKIGCSFMLFGLVMSHGVFGLIKQGIENNAGCFCWHKKTGLTQ